MATFDSTIPIAYQTKLPLSSARDAVVFEDNSHIVHSLSDNDTVLNGIIICPFLTSAQKTTVLDFYDTNKDLVWQFVNPHDGLTYDLEFVDPIPTAVQDREYSPPRYIIKMYVVGEQQ